MWDNFLMKTSVLSGNLKGSGLVAISALMFGSYGVFSRYLSSYDIFYQIFVRLLLITAIFVAVGLYKKQFKPIARQDWMWFTVMLIFTNFTIAPIVYAYQFLEIGTASFLFYASFTVFTYILGMLFFKEKMDAVKIAALVLSFAGLLTIFTFSASWLLLLPILLTILNGIASGGEVTFSKKVSDKYSNTQINTLIFGSITVTHLLLSLLVGETWDPQIFNTSLPVLLSFALAGLVGMVTVVAGFKLVEPSIGAIVGLLEIVFSVILGFVLFGEALSPKILLGGALILVAALLPSLYDLWLLKTAMKKGANLTPLD